MFKLLFPHCGTRKRFRSDDAGTDIIIFRSQQQKALSKPLTGLLQGGDALNPARHLPLQRRDDELLQVPDALGQAVPLLPQFESGNQEFRPQGRLKRLATENRLQNGGGSLRVQGGADLRKEVPVGSFRLRANSPNFLGAPGQFVGQLGLVPVALRGQAEDLAGVFDRVAVSGSPARVVRMAVKLIAAAFYGALKRFAAHMIYGRPFVSHAVIIARESA